MNFLRPVVLCADDFGLTDGVSRGILELADQGRLSATSVMANMPAWPRNAAALKAYQGRISAGLHLNLTTGAPLGPMPGLAPEGRLPSLSTLIRRAVLRDLPLAELCVEIDRQIEAFETHFGATPAFVDGHQHVHVLPGIRRVLIEVLTARGYAGRLWIRDPSESWVSILRRSISAGKALVVSGFASGFGEAARTAGFSVNEGFSGFSPLTPETDPQQVFRAALGNLGPRPVVMCHPGYADDELRGLDPAVESRVAELNSLKSDAFGALLEERGIRLHPEPAKA
ncbi:ChbG/HpnK family deacetylase [Microvirga flavescens]|uniref:ChbG/HpnK family deacetylase n=1 Tax=Microvirga flavescens TaxID=2249811 RepID=UPI000DD8F2D6|nr:ChbG/HpnK family deacetylase [Microvirga flavescens]